MEATTSTPSILTPDQRLRVFVSSTLQELSDERQSVKQAIQNMHLTPVMFELGARPHAPRDLYRQYLAQSHIFIGIYWDRYGWVAPEETVSGLEDEYNLSGSLPKLIYIKKSNGQREARLNDLLKRIQRDDKVSYKSFNTASELEDLIVNDLALLLTERFNLALQTKVPEAEKCIRSIPVIPNSIIGRESNVQELVKLINSPGHRLITLTGPGGIGKTRLALEVAKQIQCTFRDGAVYVPLAPVRDHSLVAETICYALGIKISGGNILDSLKLFLQEKRFLLLLDNFEQVIDAAAIIDDLLFAAPGLKIIITSRERLSLSFEHVYNVPTLSNACAEFEQGIKNVFPPAIRLFVERAKAIQPSFELTSQNRDTICRICKRLEGLPLAIELAAGQINLFSPAMLLQKLDHSLDILKASFRDIPDRQKTMRSTVEWSFELLSPAEQKLLLQISLYHAGCILSTIETMEVEKGEDVYTIVGSLINKSLLFKQDEEFQVRYQMMESVREFAIQKLQDQGIFETLLCRQAEYYHQALQGIKVPGNHINQTELLTYLEKEHSNIRQVLDFLTQKKDLRRMADISWNLWLFWWVNAHTKEAYVYLKKAWDYHRNNHVEMSEYSQAIFACNVGIMSFLQRDIATFNDSLVKNMNLILAQDDDELTATAMLIGGVVKTIMKEYEVANYMLDVSLERFQKIGLTTGISLALSALGRNAVYDGNRIEEGKEYYRESLTIARAEKNEISVIIALSGFALCEAMGKSSEAKKYLRESIQLSQNLHFYEALAWCMEIWSLVSVNENKPVHAVTLIAAVDRLRATAQIPIWEDLQAVILQAKSYLQQNMPDEAFLKAWNEGVEMSVDKMATFAMEEGVQMADDQILNVAA